MAFSSPGGQPMPVTLHRVNSASDLLRAQENARVLKSQMGNVAVSAEADLSSLGGGEYVFLHKGWTKSGRRAHRRRGWASRPQDYVRELESSSFLDGLVIQMKSFPDEAMLDVLRGLLVKIHRDVSVTLSSFSVPALEVVADEAFAEKVVLQQLLFTNPWSVVKGVRKAIAAGAIFSQADQLTTWRPGSLEEYRQIEELLAEHGLARFVAGGIGTVEQLNMLIEARERPASWIDGGYIDEHHFWFPWVRTALGKYLAEEREV